MPRGGNGGGGNGGGGGSGGGSVSGTRGADHFDVQTSGELAITTYDGRGGFDVLDLSALTSGVTIKINDGPGRQSILYPNREFTGIFHSFSLAEADGRLTGTIRDIEHLIGGMGDDFLYIDSPEAKIVDGGPGDDALGALGGNATLIGGEGSDVMLVYWDTNILVGGTYDHDSGIATGDGQSDIFMFGTSGTILDFEIGIDRIQLETNEGEVAGALAAEWQDTTYNGAPAAMLQAAGKTIVLAGLTAEQASAIQLEFVIGGGAAEQSGGPGDDVFYSFSDAERYLLDSGSGDDIILFFDTASDTLVFPDGGPDSWTVVDVNGESGIRGVYDGGNSSVTLLGLTLDDVSALMIEAPPPDTTLTTILPSWDGLLI